MSDMIDRLRAISAGAGRDIASDLADPSTIETMAGRVRLGVRRRRIRLGAIGASVAVIVGAAAIAAPTLLGSLPNQPDVIQPGIVRTIGPITTFDDGSISVVLSSGELVNLPPYEGDQVLTQPSQKDLCAIASPDDLPSGNWVPTTGESNLIVGRASSWVKDDTGIKQSVLQGKVVEVADPKGSPPDVFASFEVDPAVAPFVAIKMTFLEFRVDDSKPGATAFGKIYADSMVTGEPEPEYSGNADLGTRVGTVQSKSTVRVEGRGCYKYEDTLEAGFWTGTFKFYVVAEIFLVDHKGGEYPLGTSTYWFQADGSKG